MVWSAHAPMLLISSRAVVKILVIILFMSCFMSYLLDHDLPAIVDIDALPRGVAVEAATVEGVPA